MTLGTGNCEAFEKWYLNRPSEYRNHTLTCSAWRRRCSSIRLRSCEFALLTAKNAKRELVVSQSRPASSGTEPQSITVNIKQSVENCAFAYCSALAPALHES